VYTNQTYQYPWGWKSRPRDTNSLAPDDAVRIYDTTLPTIGKQYRSGSPIFWPDITNSWDMAFQLTTRTNPPTPPTNNIAQKWLQSLTPAPMAWT